MFGELARCHQNIQLFEQSDVQHIGIYLKNFGLRMMLLLSISCKSLILHLRYTYMSVSQEVVLARPQTDRLHKVETHEYNLHGEGVRFVMGKQIHF